MAAGSLFFVYKQTRKNFDKRNWKVFVETINNWEVMTMNCMNLYGRALFDYYNGDFTKKLYMCRDDGFKFELPIDIFFRDSIELGIDKKALDSCFGKVLDIGAGTGLHSLYLQNLGFEVVALDISQEACEVGLPSAVL